MRVRGAVEVSGEHDSSIDLAVRVETVSREENEAGGIVLVQALAKGGRDEMAVEAATGLGVERIVPWAAARSVVRWDGAKAQRGRGRWEAIARAETKVARRSWVPAVEPMATTGDLVRAAHDGVLAGVRLLVLHEDATTGLARLVGGDPARIGRSQGADRRATALVVGPEGGIAPDELEAFRQVGGIPVRLGHAVLRASSAGPAALAALAALRGAWN
jgi:16S rRNA (uracil1498-N3)-methyltransferase